MADTTPKGLRYPEDSDAPNIAVDIENLATDVDNEFDNYIAKSIVTAQGDLITASGSATPARLAIGAADTYLKSNGTAVSWQPVVAGGYYINSTAATALAGTDLTGLPEGEYIGTVLSINDSAAVSSDSYGQNQSFYVSQLSDITFIGERPGNVWVSRISNFGSGDNIFAFTFGNNTYLAGGDGGKLRTSTDGITWTTRDAALTTRIVSLTFGNSVFVAGAYNGQLRTSTDAITWTTRSTGLGGNWVASTSGNGVLVIATDSANLATSTDGTTWTSRTSTFGATPIRALTFGNGIFVAGGDAGQLRTSTDGITWATRTSGFGSSAIRALTFGNNTFVSGGYGATATGPNLATSTDGTTWTLRSVADLGSNQIFGLAFGSNTFVLGAYQGNVRISTNAITWTSANSQFGTTLIRAVGFGNRTFLLGGGAEKISTSSENGTFEASFAPVAQAINLP
jgi:hypothetical protein